MLQVLDFPGLPLPLPFLVSVLDFPGQPLLLLLRHYQVILRLHRRVRTPLPDRVLYFPGQPLLRLLLHYIPLSLQNPRKGGPGNLVFLKVIPLLVSGLMA